MGSILTNDGTNYACARGVSSGNDWRVTGQPGTGLNREDSGRGEAVAVDANRDRGPIRAGRHDLQPVVRDEHRFFDFGAGDARVPREGLPRLHRVARLRMGNPFARSVARRAALMMAQFLDGKPASAYTVAAARNRSAPVAPAPWSTAGWRTRPPSPSSAVRAPRRRGPTRRSATAPATSPCRCAQTAISTCRPHRATVGTGCR